MLLNPLYQNTELQNSESAITIGQKELSLIQKKIASNIEDEMRKVCVTEYHEDSNTLIISLKMERAVADTFKIFNDFVNTKIDYSYDNYVLDMSKALFMDSTFLGCIVVFFKKIHKHGSQFKLVINEEKIKILAPFEQLAKILNVCPSLDDALNSIE